MNDMMDDTESKMGIGSQTEGESSEDKTPPENELALVKKIQTEIRADKRHHEKAFKRMKRDMAVAYSGHDETWPEENYTANIAGRHVKMKTAALYAKNPRVTARRRETLDFKVWDESPESIKMAIQGIQMAQAAISAAPAAVDPVTGQSTQDASQAIPEAYQGALDQANALMADFQEGMKRRQMLNRLGKTLEVLFSQALREQKPLDGKKLFKSVVRRAATTGVGYVELAFQREYGPRQGLTEQIADVKMRIDHLTRLIDEAAEGEIEQDDAEMFELQASLAALEAEPEVLLREGLIFDAPLSTRVIPDRLTKMLDGFVGARHLTLEYLYTQEQVEETFPDFDCEDGFTPYSSDGKNDGDEERSANYVVDDADTSKPGKRAGMVCVWKHYDKASGLCYFLADGYKKFLRPPASPDVFVEDFWPVYALTFNAVESEDELFPPSDVALLLPMQKEYNRARQGQREHRDAARPRWVGKRGVLEDDDVKLIASAKPFETVLINLDPQAKIADALENLPVPGVDPNLYETNPLFTDTQLVVGSQSAMFGGVAKATATETAIAANSTNASDQSSIDDLDAFLTSVARAGCQILLREMSEEQVMRVVGPGAFWPHQSLADIADEITLEIEAGSTGRPNQAVEMANWEKMLPFLVQMPGISPTWLARETIKRLDDKADLTEAMSEGLPSIVMQNAMKQPGTGDAATDPNAQGGKGANNAPAAPGGSGGSGPAMGSNQV